VCPLADEQVEHLTAEINGQADSNNNKAMNSPDGYQERRRRSTFGGGSLDDSLGSRRGSSSKVSISGSSKILCQPRASLAGLNPDHDDDVGDWTQELDDHMLPPNGSSV